MAINAEIYFEQGVDHDYLDAAVMAYHFIGDAIGERARVVVGRANMVNIPILNSGQYDTEWIEHESVSAHINQLYIVERDLGASAVNFCFGRSQFNGRASVVSANRISPGTLVGLAVHEIGHSEGLVDETMPHYDRISQFVGHCANDCIMKPVNSVPEMTEATKQLMSCAHTAGFCTDCIGHLKQKLAV